MQPERVAISCDRVCTHSGFWNLHSLVVKIPLLSCMKKEVSLAKVDVVLYDGDTYLSFVQCCRFQGRALNFILQLMIPPSTLLTR